MTFSENCLKFLVSGANFTFALGGLALVIVGILYKLNLNGYTDAIPTDYQAIGLAPILTIVVGAVIFFIAFFGCCGAIRESTCLLTTYSVILLVIFLLQIALGVFVFLQVKDKDVLKTKVESKLTEIFSNNGTHSAEITNLIQKELKCCGINGTPSTTISDVCTPNHKEYTKDCGDAFYDFLISSINIIGITVLALSTLEVLGCVLSLCLSSSIKNRERRFRY